MIVQYQGKTWDLTVDSGNVDQVLREVEELAAEKNEVITCLEIDEEPVYTNFLSSLIERLESTSNVVIYSSTLEVLNQEIAISAIEYINNALPQIKALADMYYRTPDEQAWTELANFAEALEWFISVYQTIDLPESNDFITDLQAQIEALSIALVEKDTVMIGDLLKYEFVPIFEKIQSANVANLSKEAYQ